MRSEIGMFLMEDENGGIAVQLHASPAKLAEMFADLKGKAGDKPARATMVKLSFDRDSVSVSSETRLLPVVEPVESKPDGFVIGGGPVFIKDGKVVPADQ